MRNLRERYRVARAAGHRSAHALTWARLGDRSPAIEFGHDGRGLSAVIAADAAGVVVEADDAAAVFAALVTAEHDDVDAVWALDGIGRYTATWEPGVLDRFRGEARPCAHTMRYFAPAMSPDDARHEAAVWGLAGVARGPAWERAQRCRLDQYRLAEALENGDAWCPRVRVTVEHVDTGVKLAESSSGCGLTLYDDAGERYVEDTARDVLTETLTGARGVLAELQAPVGAGGAS